LQLSVSRLTLTDFRNYRDLRLEAGDRNVALSGPNGAGKTNLLEAVSLLVPGRGLRNAAYAEMTRRGAMAGWARVSVLTVA
jgi:DNA replication and repair protein RecF